MLITLSYPDPELGAAGATVEVDDDTGQTMIRDGLARLADSVEDALGGIAELRQYATDHDIDITGLRSKVDIAAAIEAAEQPQDPDRSTTQTPPDGADQ